jgi:hypothetical protein
MQMANKPTTNKAPATVQAPATAPATVQAPPSPIIAVQLPNGFKLPRATSARGLWLARLQQYNGKPLAAFIASVQASHPSTPTKGKLAGQLEPVQGWVSWFTRQGVLTLTQPK